ncbi:MAG: phospholipase D-like domain-containing protein, partial [Burkholderiaceae bacterium]
MLRIFRNRKFIVVLTILATAFVTVLILNLSLGDKQIDWRLPHRFAVASEQFPRTMGSLLGSRLVPGNQVQELLNGEQIFPSMLAEINSATRSISFESYIYWSGDIGRRFAEALSGKARSGVPVRVLLDWVGSEQLDPASLEQMRAAGVDVRLYNKPRWWRIGRFNNRTHRKLLIVDGRIGFTGGVGIADQWLGDGRTPGQWRDTH